MSKAVLDNIRGVKEFNSAEADKSKVKIGSKGRM